MSAESGEGNLWTLVRSTSLVDEGQGDELLLVRILLNGGLASIDITGMDLCGETFGQELIKLLTPVLVFSFFNFSRL